MLYKQPAGYSHYSHSVLGKHIAGQGKFYLASNTGAYSGGHIQIMVFTFRALEENQIENLTCQPWPVHTCQEAPGAELRPGTHTFVGRFPRSEIFPAGK